MSSKLGQCHDNSSNLVETRSKLVETCSTRRAFHEILRPATTFALKVRARCALLANNAGLTRLRLDAWIGTPRR